MHGGSALAAKSGTSGAKTAKGVKTSKTTNSKSGYTAAQRTAYRLAFSAAVKSSNSQQRANAVMQRRMQAAAAAAAKRGNLAIRRISGTIVRASYVQARYGRQAQGSTIVPVHRAFYKQSSVAAYLQVKYGKKTYALTGASHSVRVKPPARVKRGKVVAANRTAVSRGATNRAAVAIAKRAAASHAHQVTFRARQRTAPGGFPAVNPQWVTAGNDFESGNCVAVAIANHLLLHEDVRADDYLVDRLYLDSDLTIEGSLALLFHRPGLWRPAVVTSYVHLGPLNARPGMLVGFESEQGPHCGVLMPGGKVICWGEIVPLESAIEEAWDITWTVTS